MAGGEQEAEGGQTDSLEDEAEQWVVGDRAENGEAFRKGWLQGGVLRGRGGRKKEVPQHVYSRWTETRVSAQESISTTHVSAHTRTSLRRAHRRDCHVETRVAEMHVDKLCSGRGKATRVLVACLCVPTHGKQVRTHGGPRHIHTDVCEAVGQPTQHTYSPQDIWTHRRGTGVLCRDTTVEVPSPKVAKALGSVSRSFLAQPGPGQIAPSQAVLHHHPLPVFASITSL